MTQRNDKKKEDEEPTRAEWRKDLLERLDLLGGVGGMRFIVEEGYRRLDTPALKALLEALDNIFVTCDGVLYRYDADSGVYVASDGLIRPILAALVAELREERRRIDLELSNLPKSYEDALQSLIPKCHMDAKFVAAQADCIKMLCSRPGTAMDGDQAVANMQNGLLNRWTLELSPHTAEHLSSIQLPYDYDPSADCPRWCQFLEEVQPDSEVRALLQEFAGYVLVPTTKFEVALILVGPGGTGKGTFSKVIQRLVGEANCSDVALDKLGDRFMTERLRGKLLNICPEVDASKTIDEGMFKSLVSGDRRMVERKYRDPEPMVSFARQIAPANGLPTIKDSTNAFFDRLFIAEFNQKFQRQIATDGAGDGAPSADPDLLDKLTAELPGIFNWAVEGMQRLFERGRFDPPASMLRNARAYRNEQNQVYRFIDQFQDKGEGLWIESGALFEKYQQWCVAEGNKHVYDKNVFCKRVVQLNYPGVQKKDGSGKARGFSGLGVAESTTRRRPQGFVQPNV